MLARGGALRTLLLPRASRLSVAVERLISRHAQSRSRQQHVAPVAAILYRPALSATPLAASKLLSSPRRSPLLWSSRQLATSSERGAAAAEAVRDRLRTRAGELGDAAVAESRAAMSALRARKEAMDSVAEEEKALVAPKGGLFTRARAFVRDYGPVGVTFYFGVYFATLGSMYVAVEQGYVSGDVADLLSRLGLDEYFDLNAWNPSAGNFATAWILTKFTEPLRAAVTAGVTPYLVRKLRVRRLSRVDGGAEEEAAVGAAASADSSAAMLTAKKAGDADASAGKGGRFAEVLRDAATRLKDVRSSRKEKLRDGPRLSDDAEALRDGPKLKDDAKKL